MTATGPRNDDATALGHWRRHMPLLVFLTRRYYRRWPNQADDVLAEARVVFWKCCRRFDPGRNVTFGAYLSTALFRHLARNPSRLRGPVGRGSPAADRDLIARLAAAPAGPDPDVFDAVAQVRREVDRLARSNPKWHRIVTRIDLEGQTIAETARELRTSRQDVEQARQRAHKHLRNALGSRFGDEPAGVPTTGGDSRGPGC